MAANWPRGVLGSIPVIAIRTGDLDGGNCTSMNTDTILVGDVTV